MRSTRFASLSFWLLLVALPFFFLPITAEFYLFNKTSLLFISSLICLCAWVFNIFATKSLYINLSRNDLLILLMVVSITVANIISSPTIYSFTSPFGPLLYWVLFFLYLFFKSHYTNIDYEKVLTAIAVVGAILGIVQAFWLFEGVKLVDSIISLPNWLKTIYWSPLGNTYNTFSYILFSTIVSGLLFFRSFHEYLLGIFSENNERFLTRKINKNFLLISLVFTLNVCFLLISAYYLFVSIQPDIPLIINWQEGWFVLTGGLRDIKTALVGVGANNFDLLFAANRPSSFINYVSSQVYPKLQSSYIFQVISEHGLIAFFTLCLLFFRLFLYDKTGTEKNSQTKRMLNISLFSLMIIFFTSTINLSLMFLFFVLLYLHEVDEGKNIRHAVKIPFEIQQLAILTIFILVLLTTYGFSRIYFASYYYRMAINSQIKSISTQTYSLIFSSINQNPFDHETRNFLAQISHSSALSILDDKDLVKNADKQSTLVNLLAQAQNEQKQAIVLKNTPVYWHNLAKIYETYFQINPKEFTNLVLEAYQKTIEFDPRSSYYHFLLGSFFLRNNNFNLAEREFNNSIILDPSFINGLYNLFIAYKNQGDLANALSALKEAVRILPANHSQYEQVVKELSDFEKQVNEATPSANTNEQQRGTQ